MDWRNYITVHPNICHGQACIKGTRVIVSVILDNLAEGLDPQEIIRSYPALHMDAVRAAINYAAELARAKRHHGCGVTMKFKLDENLPVEVAALFREAGHDALTILDQQMGGQADDKIIRICKKERSALITLDLDFSDIKSYPPSEHYGIFVLRTKKTIEIG